MNSTNLRAVAVLCTSRERHEVLTQTLTEDPRTPRPPTIERVQARIRDRAKARQSQDRKSVV